MATAKSNEPIIQRLLYTFPAANDRAPGEFRLLIYVIFTREHGSPRFESAAHAQLEIEAVLVCGRARRVVFTRKPCRPDA